MDTKTRHMNITLTVEGIEGQHCVRWTYNPFTDTPAIIGVFDGSTKVDHLLSFRQKEQINGKLRGAVRALSANDIASVVRAHKKREVA